jgi:VWFA-related protein
VLRLRLSRVVFVLCLSATTFVSASAQQPTFRVGATFVRVDAFVTKDGKPVTDLTADDFEVFEDGVKQTIRNFELVNLAPGFTQGAPRRDPNSVADMRDKVADPRRRVFVLFLDTYHISMGSTMWSRKAFQRFVERMVGPDDLMAGMTPDMSAESLAFGSRTETLERFLDTLYGKKDALINQNEEEDAMLQCLGTPGPQNWQLLRDRWRTKKTLDAIEALVAHVGGMRDERKAIVTVSEGWQLFGPDLRLAEDPHATDKNRPIHTGPLIKTPAGVNNPVDRTVSSGYPTSGDCDAIRLQLANIETIQQFRDLPNIANRANASFYVIDPRGLPASDDLLGSPSPGADIATLNQKLSQFRELADRTDGMALFHSNNLDKELTQIADDLSSYYLLGYDSTNGKLDGSYRQLSVKVKRPGVLVRARRGYRAAVLPSGGSSNAPSGTNATAPSSSEAAVTSAVSNIMGTRADLPVRLRATAVRLVGTTTSELRIVAELDAKLATTDAWRQGGTARFVIKGEGTEAPMTAEAPLQAGSRLLTATVALPSNAAAGAYHVQMRLTAQTRTDAVSDATTVQVAAPALMAAPAMLKRGPSTGTNYLPTADVRLRRGDRLRLETPSRVPATQVKVTAVDQRGQPLNLSIQVSDRQDGGNTVIVADISLAPLAPGGYAILFTTNDDRLIVPFQVIP